MRFLKFRRIRTLEKREVVLNDMASRERATPQMHNELEKIKQILDKRYNKNKVWIKLK